MIWSIDIELDELVAESKSCESTSGNEYQKNSERDKHVVADLVKKLLVCGTFYMAPFMTLSGSFVGRRNHPTRSL